MVNDIEFENDETSSMSVTVEHTLLNIECDHFTVDQFASMHKVDANTVNKWISQGKLRHAKKVGKEWLIPNTEDKPGRKFENVQYAVKKDEQINSNEFPTLAMVESVFIHQDDTDKKKFTAHFRNYKTYYSCMIELTKDEVERLEYIIIESGKATVEGTIQFMTYIRDE